MRRLEADVFPSFGHKFIDKVTPPDIRKLMLMIESRGARDVVKRAHETTGRSSAMQSPTESPAGTAADFKPKDILAETKEENFSRVDAKELTHAACEDGQLRWRCDYALAMRLMAYTFVRTSELIEAEWTELQLDNARWDIPAERMKMDSPHIVPLSMQSVDVLRALHLLTGSGRFVFPGAHEKAKPMSNNTILFALYRLGYKGRMTGRGFRGLASTILHENDFADEHIELQLAHLKCNRVAAAYNHARYLSQRGSMMQWWADYLDAQLAKAEGSQGTAPDSATSPCLAPAMRQPFSQTT